MHRRASFQLVAPTPMLFLLALCVLAATLVPARLGACSAGGTAIYTLSGLEDLGLLPDSPTPPQLESIEFDQPNTGCGCSPCGPSPGSYLLTVTSSTLTYARVEKDGELLFYLRATHKDVEADSYDLVIADYDWFSVRDENTISFDLAVLDAQGRRSETIPVEAPLP